MAGHAVLVCGGTAPSDRPMKQEPAEATTQELAHVQRRRNLRHSCRGGYRPPSDGRLYLELFPLGLIYFPLAQDPGQKFPADVSLMRIGKS